MHHADGVLREDLLYLTEPLFEIFQVDFLTLLYQRVDNIDLPALLDLPAYRLIELGAPVVVAMYRCDGLAAGRQLVDDRDIEVAVDRHGQRAGNGRRRHHKDMGRTGVFAPQAGALFDAEAVLFVDDDKSQVIEDHRIFEQSMGSDKDLHLARKQPSMYLVALFLAGRTGKQLDAHADGSEQRAQRLIMLRGENLGRRHHAGLVTVVDGHEHRHEGDKGLAAAHIALQEAVHLAAAAHIGANLFEHPFLGTGEVKGQTLPIEAVEVLADGGKGESAQPAHTLAGIAQDIELQIEKFLEFEAELGSSQLVGRGGKMYVVKRIAEIHDMGAGNDRRRKGLGQGTGYGLPQRGDDFLHGLGVEEVRLHLFGGGIIGLQPRIAVDVGIDGVDFGVGDVDAIAKEGGSAEERIFHPGLITVLHILDSLEPHQLYRTGTIGKEGGEPAFVTLALCLITHNLSPQLDIGHRTVDFAYGVGA